MLLCTDKTVGVEIVQAYGAGQFYPGMPGGQFAPQHQRPAAQGYGPPAAGGYNSYAPPAAGELVNTSRAFSAAVASYLILNLSRIYVLEEAPKLGLLQIELSTVNAP